MLDLPPISLCKAIRDAEPEITNTHSVVIERYGKLVAEFYFNGKDHPNSAWFGREVEFGPMVNFATKNA